MSPVWANNVPAPLHPTPPQSSLPSKSLYWEKLGYQAASLIILGGLLKNCNWFLRTNKLGLWQLWQKWFHNSCLMSKIPCSSGNDPEFLWSCRQRWAQVGTKTCLQSILSGSWQGLPSETGKHRCTDLALSCGEWKSIFNQCYSIEVWHVCLLWAVAAGWRLAVCHPSTGSKKKNKSSTEKKNQDKIIVADISWALTCLVPDASLELLLHFSSHQPYEGSIIIHEVSKDQRVK